MQYAFLITDIEAFTSENSGQILRLGLKDYRGHTVSVMGTTGQQINIQTVRSQVLPIVFLADNVDLQSSSTYQIPNTALVSIVPIESTAIQAVLDSGKAKELLARFVASNS